MAGVLLGRFAKFYNGNFDKRPVPTLIVTNGILNSVADIAAQGVEIYLQEPPEGKPAPSYEPLRTARFGFYGMALGPVIALISLGRWMHLLETRIPMAKVAVGRGNTIQLFKRVMADQLLMAPAGMALFVTAFGTMEGKSVEQIKDKFSGMYWPALVANWQVWPAIQAINFKVMPLAYRVPFQSTCGIAWTIYMSLLNARGWLMPKWAVSGLGMAVGYAGAVVGPCRDIEADERGYLGTRRDRYGVDDLFMIAG